MREVFSRAFGQQGSVPPVVHPNRSTRTDAGAINGLAAGRGRGPEKESKKQTLYITEEPPLFYMLEMGASKRYRKSIAGA